MVPASCKPRLRATWVTPTLSHAVSLASARSALRLPRRRNRYGRFKLGSASGIFGAGELFVLATTWVFTMTRVRRENRMFSSSRVVPGRSPLWGVARPRRANQSDEEQVAGDRLPQQATRTLLHSLALGAWPARLRRPRRPVPPDALILLAPSGHRLPPALPARRYCAPRTKKAAAPREETAASTTLRVANLGDYCTSCVSGRLARIESGARQGRKNGRQDQSPCGETRAIFIACSQSRESRAAARDYWYFHSRTSTKWPLTAAAAAMAGETRCVRPPLPCRPSKLRLLVEAHRSPGES